MRKLNSTLCTLLMAAFLVVITESVVAQEDTQAVRMAVQSDQELGLTVEEAYGKELFFDYGSFENGTRFIMDVTIERDQITFRELWEGGNFETDPTKSIRLDEHRLLTSFVEENSSFMVAYFDFKTGETSFCGLGVPLEAGNFGCYTGVMTLKE
ncbi:MAG: hypothetical protein JJU41_08370 [Bacteroidetes bacterium]|nr:hypothetical protein [Bacteroidota bacterium]MCH8524527.1 hypothetical protein [Balneolales bacterium]